MAMAAFAAAERPLREASRSGEFPLEELFCDAEAEGVLVWVLNCAWEMGEKVREIVVTDTWVVVGGGPAPVVMPAPIVVPALVEADGVVVASDVMRVVESCILAERVSDTAVVRNRRAVYIPLHLLHC